MMQLTDLWARGTRRIWGGIRRLAPESVTSYWTRHNVTSHQVPDSAEASAEFFHWRNAQYHNYIELMPVAGVDDQVVLDYGCGPGHDLVGFGIASRPNRLIGMDVSPASLGQARRRLALHGIDAELVRLDETATRLPLDDACVDRVHSSGVLHHVPDPLAVLRELRRVLRPDGEARIMVYNYDSIWLHLYVAYVLQIVKRKWPSEAVRDAFARSTDGEGCPISRIYRPSEWLDLAAEAGFSGSFTGSAVSMFEMSHLSSRFDAIQDRRLGTEHREFLTKLRLDEQGYPRFGDTWAGVDGCYRLTPVP